VTLARTNRVRKWCKLTVFIAKRARLLFCGHHATAYRPSLHTRRATHLTALLAICPACLTAHHPGGLSFSFFWY
jgi:hypothetical protein